MVKNIDSPIDMEKRPIRTAGTTTAVQSVDQRGSTALQNHLKRLKNKKKINSLQLSHRLRSASYRPTSKS